MDDSDEFERIEIVRAKWSMDGATTLTEAGSRLREYAAYLEELEQDGWQLVAPVEDDYGQIANPDPSKRLSVAVEDRSVGSGWLEHPTSAMSTLRSNQLS